MDSSATQGISTKVVTDFANQNENSIFASATSSVRDEITNNNLELAEQKKAEIGYNAPSPIMTEANIAKYGSNLAYEMPLSYGNFSSSSSTSSSTSNSSSTDRYNENTCYITNVQTNLNQIGAARFLDDFIDTKKYKLDLTKDLGIAQRVITVIYKQGFFNYRGVSIFCIDLNATGDYIEKDLDSPLVNYKAGNGSELTRFSFKGHFKNGQGLNLWISVKYSDRDKFSDMLNV